MIRYILIGTFGIYLAIFGIYPTLAQDPSGQFCIRSYEDVNSNGLFDTESERLITRGVGVELLDNDGVVVGSALLDKSPTAANGIICFYNLSEGDYSVLVSSADYLATTERLVQQAVSNSAPTIVEFGARRLGNEAIAQPIATSGAGNFLEPARLAVSTVAAAVMMILFLLTGFLVYGLQSRRRAQVQPVQYNPESVRNFEPLPVEQPVSYTAPAIDEPPISPEDTNPVQSSPD